MIYQIILKDYINYFHYLNIEKIFAYLIQEYDINYNNKYTGYGKIIFENGDYYIGGFKNGLINGKGILYYGNIKSTVYFDYYIYAFDNKSDEEKKNIEIIKIDYYIGEFKDKLKHGKGLAYFKNGQKYRGEFINGKFEGNGKFIDGYGNYYIGEFKKGSRHGKGILYDKNGNILYEGDFSDG